VQHRDPRAKDIIIRGGTNISPVEVEQALVAAHPGVEQAAVVGIPDAVLGQRVFGFVKLAKGMSDTIVSEILGNVATRLASYKVPEGLKVVDELPRNALSKVDRNMLQTTAAGTNKVGKILGVLSLPKQTDERLARRVARNR
jgi:acyl-coenzyme A synthetase/AMP-(fatty) acid ligase